MNRSMNRYLMEFIGTFFLVLTVGTTALLPGGGGVLTPLAIGSALMIMVYAGGHISGGHYNPAVTLALFLRGKSPRADLAPYMVAQAVAALVAAGVVYLLGGGSPMFTADREPLRTILAEFLFTFALCTVVLQVASSSGTTGNSYYGLAIGFTVMIGAVAVGGLSGGVFNPAVALGITAMGLSSALTIWVYLIAQFSAAYVAARVFKITNPGE